MTTVGRDIHRQLDCEFASVVDRDDRRDDGSQDDIVRPRRFHTKDMRMSDAALIKVTRLWAKNSQKNGRQYLVGRLGGLRVLVFENTDKRDDDDHTHVLMVGEAEDRPRQEKSA
jgi:hypothetical protein